MASSAEQNERHTTGRHEIEVPAPTAWPFVMAFGITLMFTGLLTNVSVSILGVVLTVAGTVGWFRDVLPQEKEIALPIEGEEIPVETARRSVERRPEVEAARAWLPLETYKVSDGVKGGLAGSVAMAVLACTYGLVKAGSIWYPINLLAATVYEPMAKWSIAELSAFHGGIFLLAVVLHGVTSLLVGLLYGAMLPMLSKRPIVLGGLIAPVLWSGLLYSILDLLNPLLASHIDWEWFIASQVAFGVVAGLVVVRQERVKTRENMPFAVRLGIEAPGIMDEKLPKDESR
jgi:hypothetical protein